MIKHLIYVITLSLGVISCTSSEVDLYLKSGASTSVPSLAKFELGSTHTRSALKLMAHTKSQSIEIPYQKVEDHLLWRTIPDALKYTIISEDSSIFDEVELAQNEEQIEVFQNGIKIIGYQTATKDVPEGVSELYKRSGFIHPLNTPSGKRLTRIQPEDHYHHYGIWNPWTHTLVEGDTIDFWNLNKGEGTVRFSKLLNKSSGPVYSEFEVLHEHVVLQNNSSKVVLNEVQKIKTMPLNDNKYLVDIVIDYECVSNEPFKIIEYRYGGFGWRTTEEWDNQNSTVLSSEGMTRKDADGSVARWVIVQGQLGDDNGGVLLLSHPDNFNHPEPLRVWPENQYGRGDLFVNFATTKNTDWTLSPGENYTLRYQLIVFDGTITSSTAEKYWSNYKTPLEFATNP